ncbi:MULTISPECIES: Asp23/Gls24 family envelope stress response protein [Rhodococcus]|uniref:Asp23/Gls24 family envelope stress response protein n=1 Tax=Rhodococcus globerulus TaxID=33008 RepID=UPI001FD4FFB7|nr:Asp23/Gls24 family envelope stress response protein [Rhodococcus globerulus]
MSGPQRIDLGLAAETVADAALAVHGVAALHGGEFGEVGTYLPGKRVTGVVIDENGCNVHISVAYPANVVTVAQHVRDAVGQVVDVPITVTVGDVSHPDDQLAPLIEERN